MIEQLKDLEQEVMDELTPEEYMAITSNVLDDYDRPVYQAGYLDGLQTAIRLLSEDSNSMSYTIDIDEMFGEDYARMGEDEDTN
tara:strand:+ start:293 stop:544 length:252 start_codon:yes stop_codon:yes gene_type:complete